jgi:lysophospholipase L1-like esterase
MKYLALGDSISIDDYTGVPGGGAASQFARLLPAVEFQDLTRDGCVTDGVLEALYRVTIEPDVVTLTAGGNDFLMASYQGQPRDLVERPLGNLDRICLRLAAFGCPVILNTIYDPTDGDDRLAAQVGVPPEFRRSYDALNQGIRDLATTYGFLLSDLEKHFHGHGMLSREPWIVMNIEPNYAGATAIAKRWLSLIRGAG